MIVVGYLTAIDAAGRGATIPGIHPLSFLIVPISDIGLFAGYVGAALYFRRRPDAHKRLMLLATANLLTAAIARLEIQFIGSGNPPVFFGLTDLFVLALAAYDLSTHRRLHPATLWGGLLLVISQPLRVVLSESAPGWRWQDGSSDRKVVARALHRVCCRGCVRRLRRTLPIGPSPNLPHRRNLD